MKKYYFFLFVVGLFTMGLYAQENKNTNNNNIIIEEIVIKAEADRNFGGKIIDMGQYYYCKFNERDERNAILDGHVVMSPTRIKQIKRKASREHNVNINDIFIISGKETNEYGYYQLCAGGTKYDYIRKGSNYVFYKKLK